jgi:hypothetical protein
LRVVITETDCGKRSEGEVCHDQLTLPARIILFDLEVVDEVVGHCCILMVVYFVEVAHNEPEYSNDVAGDEDESGKF